MAGFYRRGRRPAMFLSGPKIICAKNRVGQLNKIVFNVLSLGVNQNVLSAMSRSVSQILVVVNDPELSGALSSVLQDDGVMSCFAFSSDEARRFFHEWPADAILLDADKTELLSEIKDNAVTQNVTIIVFTSEPSA